VGRSFIRRLPVESSAATVAVELIGDDSIASKRWRRQRNVYKLGGMATVTPRLSNEKRLAKLWQRSCSEVRYRGSFVGGYEVAFLKSKNVHIHVSWRF
jgi:hypothetical protein